ncbi:hypothetical protein ACQY0O_007416 [Thecaphora frezii]
MVEDTISIPIPFLRRMQAEGAKRILPLAAETRGSIQASLMLLSPMDIVDGLMRDAIRACPEPPNAPATDVPGSARQGTVAVMLDCRTWTIVVRDDGVAQPHRFRLSRTDGERSTLELASFLGVVQVRYHSASHSDDQTDCMLTLKNGKVLYDGPTPSSLRNGAARSGGSATSEDDALELIRDGSGSTVLVRDVFGKLPVRRKALNTYLAQKKHRDRFRWQVEQLALLHPGIAFRFGVCYGPLGPSTPARSGAAMDEEGRTALLWGLPKAADVVARSGELFGPSLVQPHLRRRIWAEEVLCVKSEATTRPQTAAPGGGVAGHAAAYQGSSHVRVRLRGFYSTASCAARQGQHIYLNQERLPSCLARGTLVPEMDGLAEMGPSAWVLERELARFGLSFGPASSLLPDSTRRPTTSGHVSSGSHANPVDANDLYGAVASAVQARLQNRGGTAREDEVVFLLLIEIEDAALHDAAARGVTGREKVLSLQTLAQMANIAILGQLPPSPKGEERRLAETKRVVALKTVGSSPTKKQRTAQPAAPAADVASSQLLPPPSQPVPEGMVLWQDPKTQRNYYVDKRTGTSYPTDDPRFTSVPPSSSSLPQSRTGFTHAVDRSQLAKVPTAIGAQGEKPGWLLATIDGWKNPAFSAAAAAAEEGGGRLNEVPVPALPSTVVGRKDARRAAPHVPSRGAASNTADQRPAAGEAAVEVAPSPSSASPRKRAEPITSRFFRAEKLPRRPICTINTKNGDADTPRVRKFREVEQCISRSALSDAEVVGQVDEKFIACLLPTNIDGDEDAEDTNLAAQGRPPVKGGPKQRNAVLEKETGDQMLVYIDQHAADERVRYERIIQDYLFPGEPFILNDGEQARAECGAPLMKALKNRHQDVYRAMEAELQFWGFDMIEITKRGIIRCQAVPDPWTDKVVRGSGKIKDAKIVAEIILEIMEGLTKREPLTLDECGEWYEVARFLPSRVKEWVANAACRGAIMFNDPLTKEECKKLVMDMASCQFPFICAHGRPSVVPACLL